MPRPAFLPTARQTNILLIVGFLSLGYALYLRYLVVEPSSVGLACDAGLPTWLCTIRRIAMMLFNNSFFGWAALVFAVLNLLRPSVTLFALGLAPAAFGMVLYNVGLAGLGAAILTLSFARPRSAAG